MTPLLYESANASVIEDTLNSLDSIGNIGKVSVRMKRTEEEVQLTILFLSTEINLSDIIVTEHDNYTSEVIQDARNPLHEFSLSYGSKTTKLVNATSTDEQVQEEVYGLFTTDCQVGDKGDVFFYDSYEGRTSPIFNGGSLDSSVEPYCGRFSIRNPVEVFENNNGYSTVTVSMFGHRYVSGDFSYNSFKFAIRYMYIIYIYIFHPFLCPYAGLFPCQRNNTKFQT